MLGFDPDAGGVGVGVGDDAELGECGDDGGFECADVLVYAEARGAQVDDWVADELAWAVVGDIAAAVCRVELDALSGEELLAGEDVGLCGWSAGDGDDGVVLDHEHAARFGIWGVAGVEDLLVVGLLEFVGLLVAEVLERDVCEGLHGWIVVGGDRERGSPAVRAGSG